MCKFKTKKYSNCFDVVAVAFVIFWLDVQHFVKTLVGLPLHVQWHGVDVF